MTDVFSKEKRSQVMASIRSTDTKPELALRHALHKLGYRYRLHVKSLPGKPDIVLPKYKTIIQVRGCFWHGHHCKDGHIPKTRVDYWKPKLSKNIQRDNVNDQKLVALGWKLIVVWECELSTYERLRQTVKRIINDISQQ